MTTLKDIQNELNSKKGLFVQKIVTEAVKHTTITAEKTKDTNYAGQIVKAAQDLASENTNIPDIIINGGGTAPVAEPSVIIRGIHGDDKNKSYIGYMAKTMYVPLSETDKEIHIIFETKNIKLDGGGYRYRIFAKEEKGRFTEELVLEDNNKFNERDPNILTNMRLPPARYDIFVLLYENNSDKKIVNSKGEQVLDYARIEIKPAKTTGGSHIKIITPASPWTVKSGVDIDYEVHTDIKPPFSFSIFYQKEGPIVDGYVKAGSFSGIIKGKFRIPKAYHLIKELKFLIYTHPHNKPETVIAESKVELNYS